MPIRTLYSPLHVQHAPPLEFMHGKFVPYYESPTRIHNLRQGLESAGVGTPGFVNGNSAHSRF